MKPKNLKTIYNQGWRKRNPLKYSYLNLKSNAKRRGKGFNLTFEEFCEFAIKTQYIARKGRYKQHLHIDRIDESKGYTKENIQTLTNTENLSTFLSYHWDDRERKMNFTFVTTKIEIPDCPF